MGDKKLTSDLLWNIGSVGVLALAGLAVNGIIAMEYGAEGLGIFHQVYAIFVLCSHAAVFGIHYSVLRHVSLHAGTPAVTRQILSSAVFCTAGIALLVVLLLWATHGLIGRLFGSASVATGILYTIPGLWLFALNKVFHAHLNGMRSMRAFAAVQSLRYLFLVIGVWLLAISGVDRTLLPVAFSASEFLLFLLLSVWLFASYVPDTTKSFGSWLRMHLSFGAQAAPSGFLSEIQIRVDVLMLGVFVSDAIVGIYGFVSLFVEGFMQILAAVRSVINPRLSQLFVSLPREEFGRVLRRGMRISLPLVALLGLVTMVAYPLFIRIFSLNSEFFNGVSALIILLLGVIITSGYQIVSMIFIQTGYPSSYTLLLGVSLMANIVLNAIAIPLWGIEGAALATAMSLLAFAIGIRLLAKRKLGIVI